MREKIIILKFNVSIDEIKALENALANLATLACERKKENGIFIAANLKTKS